MKRDFRTSNAALTAAEVQHIRRVAAGSSARDIADIYGVGVETIRRILRRETWAWLPHESAPTQEQAQSSLDKVLEDLAKT